MVRTRQKNYEKTATAKKRPGTTQGMESVVPIIDGIEPTLAEGNIYSSDQEASVGTAAVRSGDGVARGGSGTGGGGSAINDGINGHNIEVSMEELKAAMEGAKQEKGLSILQSAIAKVEKEQLVSANDNAVLAEAKALLSSMVATEEMKAATESAKEKKCFSILQFAIAKSEM